MEINFKNSLIKICEESNIEVCGFLYINFNTMNFYNCKNISINPQNTFEISQDDYLKVENMGTIVGIFHSHVDEDSDFSESDKHLAEEMNLPIFCYSKLDKKIQEYRPNDYRTNLYQREFVRGIYDCYSLVRDYYWNNFQYLLDDFDRSNNFENENSPIILENFEKQGFYIPENQIDIKEHDILLYKSIKCAYPHHFEIFIGNSRTLQHLKNRLSGKDIISEGLFKKLYKVVRFKDFSVKRNISFC